MNSIREQAEYAIRVREATPGLPQDGPYPATIEEVADELASFIDELDATCARGVRAALIDRFINRDGE